MFSVPKAFSYHVPYCEINATQLKTCLEFALVTFQWSPSYFKVMKNSSGNLSFDICTSIVSRWSNLDEPAGALFLC